MNAATAGRSTHLGIVLGRSEIGPRLGVYFTIERMRNTPARQSAFERKLVLDLENIETIDELVDRLREELKGKEIHVIRSVDRPNVIHLVEAPLVERDGYVMNERVDFAYSGKLGLLATALGERVPSIGPRHLVGSVIGTLFDDHITTTRLNITDKSVRQILTLAPPLEGYNHFLWRAETDLEGVWKAEAGVETVVQFYGPKPSPSNQQQREEGQPDESGDDEP